MLRESDVVDTWRRAPLAEVAFVGPDGTPQLVVVVPLTDDGKPSIALPYADLDVAEELAVASEVVLTVAALAPPQAAVRVRARPRLTADPQGAVFAANGLLDQELAKHPPSRRRIDSLLLRREHWWFMPRLLVRFEGVTEVGRLAEGDALIAVAAEELHVDTCTIEARSPHELRLRTDLTSDGRAAVLEHGADVPDLEQPWHRRWRGRRSGPRLLVSSYDEVERMDTPPGLMERWQRERRLERRCRANLRRAGVV